jgi:peptidoglycan/LPS O-acetylase OafA/YrhL
MKLSSIQLLRAIAIILVVYAHSIDLQMIFSHSFQQDFFYLQNFGAFGVDLFFVVSGFVISMVATRYNGARAGFRFLARRFTRLNPVYYLASALFLPVLFLRHANMNGFLLHHGVLEKTLLVLPFFDNPRWIIPVLPIGWTLSFEWLFYMQFFIAILCVPRKKEWLIGLLITGMVGLGIVFKNRDPRWIFLTSPIQLEFLLGVMIFRLYNLNVQPRLAKTIAWICLVGGTCICLFLIFTGFEDDLEMVRIFDDGGVFSRLMHWATASGLLVTGFTFMEKSVLEQEKKIPREAPFPPSPINSRKHRGKIVAWLLLCGDASYSIYLTHLLIFAVCRALYSRLGFPPAPDLAVFAQMALALFLGILFYKWVESPLLNWLKTSPRLK